MALSVYELFECPSYQSQPCGHVILLFASDVNKATTPKAKATTLKAKATTPKAMATYLKAKNTTTFPQHLMYSVSSLNSKSVSVSSVLS